MQRQEKTRPVRQTAVKTAAPKRGPAGSLATRPSEPWRHGQRLVPWLAAAATFWAAVPSVWPAARSRPTWATGLFVLAAAAAALSVARLTDAAAQPGAVVASAKTGMVLILVVAVPVVFDPRGADSYNLTKFTFTVIGALAIIAMWAVEAVSPGKRSRWRNGLHWPVLGLLTWTLVATATSVSPRVSILGSLTTNDGLIAATALAVIFFAVVQTVAIGRVKAVLSLLYFGAGGLTVGYGLIQLHDRLLGGSQWDWIRSGAGLSTRSSFGGAIFSTFGNPNHLGGFLAVLLPLGWVLFVLHRSWPARAAIMMMTAGIVAELLQTASRGALLGAVVALGVTAALFWPDIRRRPRFALPIGALAAAALVAVLAFAAQSELSTKLSTGLANASTGTLRLDFWRAGVAMTNDRPLVGYGPDTFRDVYLGYKSRAIAEQRGTGQSPNGAHNMFVSQLSGTGYPGAALLLGLLGQASLRAIGTWRRLRQIESGSEPEPAYHAHQARLCLIGVVGGMAAFLIQATFNLSQIGLSFLFWVLLGLLCVLSLAAGVPPSLRVRSVLARPTVPDPLAADFKAPSPTSRRPGHNPAPAEPDLARRSIAVVAGFGLLVAGSQATRPLRADHSAAASSRAQAMARGASAEQAGALTHRALTELVHAVELNPWEATLLARHADAFFAVALASAEGSPEQAAALRSALRASERVVALRPRSSPYLERYADVLLKIYQSSPNVVRAKTEAVQALQRAVNAEPTSAHLRERLRLALES